MDGTWSTRDVKRLFARSGRFFNNTTHTYPSQSDTFVGVSVVIGVFTSTSVKHVDHAVITNPFVGHVKENGRDEEGTR